MLAAAELVVLVREHMARLQPHERRRVFELVRRARGRPANLSKRERAELAGLVAKMDPGLFAQMAVQKVTGIRLPRRDGDR